MEWRPDHEELRRAGVAARSRCAVREPAETGQRAGGAYARNQGISTKAGRGVFAEAR